MRSILRLTPTVLFLLSAWGLDPITSNEAVQLLSSQGYPLASAETRMMVENGTPLYTVGGLSKGTPVMAVIDARASRVLEIRKNGEVVYTFPGVVTVGHRGTVKFAPENTIAAFNAAIEHGADLLEMDVRQTSDGQLGHHARPVRRPHDGPARRRGGACPRRNQNARCRFVVRRHL